MELCKPGAAELAVAHSTEVFWCTFALTSYAIITALSSNQLQQLVSMTVSDSCIQEQDAQIPYVWSPEHRPIQTLLMMSASNPLHRESVRVPTQLE